MVKIKKKSLERVNSKNEIDVTIVNKQCQIINVILTGEIVELQLIQTHFQALHAQNAGYAALIIYRRNSYEDLVTMDGK